MLKGEKVNLRPAMPADRKVIYEWLAHSDITSLMLGSPLYPDVDVPTWDQFVNDYTDHFFDGSQPMKGRCFIIIAGDTEVGQVSYNDIFEDGSTELDIWLRSSSYTGRGYGSDALQTLCAYLHQQYRCKRFYIAPSGRNTGALQVYYKAGFKQAGLIPSWFVPDYDDTIVLAREIS